MSPNSAPSLPSSVSNRRTRPLTARQTEVLDFIRDFIAQYGYSPSMRDIAEGIGFALKGAQDHVTALERKGAIERDKGVARSIRIASPRSAGSVEKAR